MSIADAARGQRFVGCRIPEADLQALDREAAVHRRSRSFMLREAVAAYVQRGGNAERDDDDRIGATG